MIHQFNIDTEECSCQIEIAIASILTLISSDWKDYIIQWANELDSSEYNKCPNCDENVHNDDFFCRWCGKQIKDMEQYK